MKSQQHPVEHTTTVSVSWVGAAFLISNASLVHAQSVLLQQPAHLSTVPVGKNPFDPQFAIPLRVKLLEVEFLKEGTSALGYGLHEIIIQPIPTAPKKLLEPIHPQFSGCFRRTSHVLAWKLAYRSG